MKNKCLTNVKPISSINLRLIGAIYFAAFAVFFTLIVKYFIYISGTGVFLPIFSAITLSVELGAFFGFLFGQRIAGAKTSTQAFLQGMLLAIAIIPFYTLGLQLIYYFNNHSLYNNLHQWQDYLVLYGILLLMFILVAGIWFIPLTGLAAMQFNRRFLTGYQAYLQQQSAKC